MRKIKIISRKYDGRLRDEYEAWLAAEDEETITVYAPLGTRSFDHRKQTWFEAPDGLLEVYSKRHWYVIWHICEKREAATNDMYVHIAMPAQFSEATLEWVDLDLDYRWYEDDQMGGRLGGRLEPLDEAEFRQHIAVMSYPDAVVAQAYAAFEEVGRLCLLQTGRFDHGRYVEIYRTIKAQTG